ncbi:hypothetical protein [Mastigocladopsis repens]|nr:hypothetical protein [Mastigocladopsis repens]
MKSFVVYVVACRRNTAVSSSRTPQQQQKTSVKATEATRRSPNVN